MTSRYWFWSKGSDSETSRDGVTSLVTGRVVSTGGSPRGPVLVTELLISPYAGPSGVSYEPAYGGAPERPAAAVAGGTKAPPLRFWLIGTDPAARSWRRSRWTGPECRAAAWSAEPASGRFPSPGRRRPGCQYRRPERPAASR